LWSTQSAPGTQVSPIALQPCQETTLATSHTISKLLRMMVARLSRLVSSVTPLTIAPPCRRSLLFRISSLASRASSIARKRCRSTTTTILVRAISDRLSIYERPSSALRPNQTLVDKSQYPKLEIVVRLMCVILRACCLRSLLQSSLCLSTCLREMSLLCSRVRRHIEWLGRNCAVL